MTASSPRLRRTRTERRTEGGGVGLLLANGESVGLPADRVRRKRMVIDGPLWRRTARRRHARAVIRSCASGGARVDRRRSNARAAPRRAKFGRFDARRRRATRGGRPIARDQAGTSDILVAIRDARRRECPSPACAGGAVAVSARNRGVPSGGLDGDRCDRASAAGRSSQARRQVCRSSGARGARCGDRRAYDRRAGVDATQTSRPQAAATISWERDDPLQTADIYGRSADKPITRDKLLQPAPRVQSLRTTQVVIDRWPWTTVVFNGSSNLPPRRCVSAMSSGSSTR
jgi:hypothetical protein